MAQLYPIRDVEFVASEINIADDGADRLRFSNLVRAWMRHIDSKE